MKIQPKNNCIQIFIVIACLLCGTKVSSQIQQVDQLQEVIHKHEISLHLGYSNFLGDLGGNKGVGRPFAKDFKFQTLKPLIGFSYAYYPQNWYKLTIGLNITSVNGADSLTKNQGTAERWRVYRNLSFRSSIFEMYAGAEVYLLSLIDIYHPVYRLDPFVGLGIGFFHFNPQANLNGQWIDLQPLHLEGEGFAEYPTHKNYKLTQAYVPITLGLKYSLSDNLTISGGVVFRKTFTDYIDDVSTTYIDPVLFDKYLTPANAQLAKQLYSRSLTPDKVRPGVDRGHIHDKDSYVTMFFKLGLTLGSKHNPYDCYRF